jgi:hypothetical protein
MSVHISRLLSVHTFLCLLALDMPVFQVIYLVNIALVKAGIKTKEVMTSHGFRKFFKSTAEQSPMKSINVEILMGHNIGVSRSYYHPKESEVLEDYLKAIDALTIDPKQRLEKENQELKSENTEEIAKLKAQVEKMKQNHSDMLKIKAQVDHINKYIDRVDFIDLQSFPSDYTIHNLLCDCGIGDNYLKHMTKEERERARMDAERLKTKLIRPTR